MKQGLFLMAFILANSNVFAQISETLVAVDTGTCGVACTWTFYDNGLLDISGEGAMDDWIYSLPSGGSKYITDAPWQEYSEDVLKVNVSEGITTLGDSSFMGLSSATEINLPNTLEVIGRSAIRNTPALKSFEIPSSVTTIGWGAFHDAGIENLVVPDSVTSIDVDAFTSTYLRTLVLPENLLNVTDTLLRSRSSTAWRYSENLLELYCGDGAKEDCQDALNWLAEGSGHEALHPIIYSKDAAGNYYMYDEKGNMVGKYANLDALKGKSPSETYKYDSAGHLVGIFDGNGQRTWGKKIYTVEEAMEVTKNGDKFHVYLTYK